MTASTGMSETTSLVWPLPVVSAISQASPVSTMRVARAGDDTHRARKTEEELAPRRRMGLADPADRQAQQHPTRRGFGWRGEQRGGGRRKILQGQGDLIRDEMAFAAL